VKNTLQGRSQQSDEIAAADEAKERMQRVAKKLSA
jgi:hypothetical protein